MTTFQNFYFIIHIFLFLSALYLFFKTTPDLMKTEEYRLSKTFLIAFGVYLILTVLWTMQEFELIHFPRPLYTVCFFFEHLAVCFNAYCFFAVIMHRFGYDVTRDVRRALCGAIPFAASFVLLVVSLFNGMIVSTQDGIHVTNGQLYDLLPFCSFLYFVAIVSVSVARAVKHPSPATVRSAIGVSVLIVFLTVWTLLDAHFESITILPIAIFSVILFLFIDAQQSGVYTDALTGLNNRRKAEEYLESHRATLSESSPLFLFVGDINSFKKINDGYGHAEGDAALTIFARAVKKVVPEPNGFAARFGGDEFLWVWRPQKNAGVDPDQIIADIREELNVQCEEGQKPYLVTISVGYVRCTDPGETINSYVKEADRLMYLEKEAFHANEKIVRGGGNASA